MLFQWILIHAGPQHMIKLKKSMVESVWSVWSPGFVFGYTWGAVTKGRPNTPPKSCSVARTLKCSVKSYVTKPSTKCYFNEFWFIQVLTHDKIEEINGWERLECMVSWFCVWLHLRGRDHTTWFLRWLGDGFWKLSFGLSQFHDHGSWPVCDVALSVPPT
jgi:hypothetical protein